MFILRDSGESKEIYKDSADKIGTASGYTGNPGHTVAFRYGRINAGAAVKAALDVPSLAAAQTMK